ncbi:hypothetical protein NVP1072O_45 [Vibrio phage 1.072.O._10N.286.48.A12]|nr:hypothetical protein NVP1004O_44 [Vibrio phage 1.004.O._10N.261.54.A2]AUR83604.1 hypothetical protein NVP1037O_44 [Vibrio phage 1.037.O._10N.261.52.F7]AUR84489.1 hypothetical protein NVP1056O_47 [Vibrio phage 1.056.O._10N.261.48.C11]AUR85006.1 hypothetical protein NVP1066O_47 [Vibrio phage 1.066.O._10N.286.46.E8]AUR85137.1 hypothetical protein NVP1068O_47 [Vibrio phage 1.068.O._10N.261.51.F8]AUR85362.1 hypothetical protein NVP1072O_45 [Vibrio phage 1.072.O._10N.286.48.A12]
MTTPVKPSKPSKPTTIVVDEAPKMEMKEQDLPKVLNVRNKNTGITAEVTRDHYLAYEHVLELI